MRAYPQPGIFSMGARTHYYLELDLRPGADVTGVLEAIAGEQGRRSTTGGCNVVVAFSGTVWEGGGGVGPAGFTAFESVVGHDGVTMPADQHDVWLWVSGPAYDVVFDTARLLAAACDPLATMATQRAGFTYGASRDLSGFEDGTENPPLDEAPRVATVPDGLPGEGGSVVLFQRWVHDLATLHALPVGEQELIFGRTKDRSEELDDEVKPSSAHIERVVIEEDGEELEVFRRSVPYGDLEEHGLLFVAFSADQARLEQMLDRMVGKEDGVVDAITRWSTPTSGAYYFAPPLDALQVVDNGDE